jgi:hypothetical protein
MKKKFFNYFYVFSVIFSFLRKSHFLQKLSILASRPHDIRNLLIKSNKKKKNLEFYPTSINRWGHLTTKFSYMSYFKKLKQK